MARLAPILILAICLTFGTTSLALADQPSQLKELTPVNDTAALFEEQAGVTSAGSDAATPTTTPAEIPQGTTGPLTESDDLSTPLESSGSEVSRGSSTTRSIITCSMRFLGSPYRYGGTTARGFDCSGFVGHVFGLNDIKLPRSSREQAKVGTHVEKDSLIPTDLVFFKTGGSSRINHVGIYLGDSRFIHASSTRGIVINSLDDKYYKKAYYGARRVLKN